MTTLKKVRGGEAEFKKGLEKLVRIARRKRSTNEQSRAVQEEYQKQIDIAFRASGFPEHTKEEFDRVYGKMLLAVGFKFSRSRGKDGRLVERKRFTGFSITKALQYLDPYLPQVYDYTVCERFKGLRDGGVIETSESLYEKEYKSLLAVGAGLTADDIDGIKELQSDRVAYCHKLSRNVKNNAQRLARIFTSRDLQSIPIENNRMTTEGYKFIYKSVLVMLQRYVTQQLAEVIQPTFDFPEIVFKHFHLPLRDRGMSVLELAPIALSVELEDKSVDVVLTPKLLETIESVDRQFYEYEQEILSGPR